MSLSATEADIGKQGKCSRCGTVFTIQMPQAFTPPVTPYQPPQSQAAPQWSDVTPGVIRVGEGISRGFSMLHSNIGAFLLIGLVSWAIDFGLIIAGQIPCVGALVGLANGFILTPTFRCGIFRASFKQHDGSVPEVGDLFAEFSQWVDYLLLILVQIAFAIVVCIPGGVLILVGCIPLMQGQQEPNIPILVAGGVLIFICSVILGLAFAFTLPALQDRRKGFWDAIQTSWRLMTSNPIGTLGLVLFEGVIRIVGFLPCTLGLIYAIPAVHCMVAATYRTAIAPQPMQPQAYPTGAPPVWQPPPAGPAAPFPPPAPGGTF